MKDLRAQFDMEKDVWLVEVPHGLPAGQMTAIKDYLLSVWVPRLIGLSAGDRKDYFTKGVAALTAGRLQQVISRKGDQDIFKSTFREHPNKTFLLPTF